MSASSQSNGSATYSNTLYICDITFSPSQFRPVGTHYTTQGIRIIGSFRRCHLSSVDTNITTSLHGAFQDLPKSLQDICGSICFPPDDGKNIIDNTHDSMTLFGASDASLKDSKGSHAWIISTGLPSDISDETRNITGNGPVDGFIHHQSSSRGELQGITAVSIFSQLLLHFHKVIRKIDIICDSQGMVNRCANIHFKSLRSHRMPNADLFLTQKSILSTIPTALRWVKGHCEKEEWTTIEDLIQQELTRDEIFNVWCNQQARIESSSNSFPIENQEVKPSENWAVYSNHPSSHKIIGDLGKEISLCLGFEALLSFLSSKHNLSEAKLTDTTLPQLGSFLRHNNLIYTRIQSNYYMDGTLLTLFFNVKVDAARPYVPDVSQQSKRLIISWSVHYQKRNHTETRSYLPFIPGVSVGLYAQTNMGQ